MPVTPANRDRLREQAFALSAQGIGVREIASRLGINKDTATKYVREERQRRSHDRHAEDAIRDAVASLRHILTDLHERYGRIEGDGPHAMYARAKVAEAIRRCCRDLIGLYGVTLPQTDPERVAFERMLEMSQAPLPTPGGYPAVGEQAVLDRMAVEADQRLADLGVIAPERAPSRVHVPPDDEDDGGHYFSGGWGGDIGEGY